MRTLYLILFLSLYGLSQGSAQVAVIAHKDVPESALSKTKLVDIYTGDIQKWKGDLDIVVFDLKQKGKVKDDFYDYLGKSPSRLKSVWMKRMLSGEGDPPIAAENEAEMLTKVAETPGAIGFISTAKVTDAVKVLLSIPAENDN